MTENAHRTHPPHRSILVRWDEAGNLGQLSTLDEHSGEVRSRFLLWTEDNRLHTVADDRSYSYYAYDHTGQRVLKLTGASAQLDINADFLRTHTVLTEPTLYPSPYVVLSNHGYTKHYYAGTERVAARIGGGNLDHDTACIVADEEAMERADRLFDWCLRQVNETAIAPLDLSSLDIRTIDGDRMDAPWWLDEAPTGLEAGLKLNVWKLLHAMDILSSPSTVPPDTDDEPDVYFYHSDHLGSASWITEAGGKPVQHIQYLPYGEPFVNQRAAGSTYRERFTFTGKERDEETGYSYFGARYMDHELMTMWLSVDPLSDKYPSISPYAYCAWNPIKLIDPDGKDVWEIDGEGNVVKRIEDNTRDAFYMVDDKGHRIKGAHIEFKYGTIMSMKTLALDGGTYDMYQIKGDENGKQLFEFLADNSRVEYSHAKTGIAGKDAQNFITTSHTVDREKGMSHLWRNRLGYGYTVREINHSHPDGFPLPSGLPGTSSYGKSDIANASIISGYYFLKGMSSPSFNVYNCNGHYTPYSHNSTLSDFSGIMEKFGISYNNGVFYW